MEDFDQEENELAAHLARNWPTEDERPEVDPEAQKEIDKLWQELHGQEESLEPSTKEESGSNKST